MATFTALKDQAVQETTLLNLISGLLAPDSGEILVDNRIIHKKNYNNIFKQ